MKHAAPLIIKRNNSSQSLSGTSTFSCLVNDTPPAFNIPVKTLFYFSSPHAVIWTVYWRQLEATVHPTFHKSRGDSSQRPPEKHMQEKTWTGKTE